MFGKKLAAFLNIIVWIIFVVDILLTITAPYWITYDVLSDMLKIDPIIDYVTVYETAGPFSFLLAFIIFCGIALGGILLEISIILKSICKDKPFDRKNAKSLKIASFLSGLILIAFIIKLFVSPTLLTLICIGGIFIFGIFLLVLSELFLLAHRIKEENEMTI